MKINTAKKVLMALGLGFGLALGSIGTSSAVNCNWLLYQCEYGTGPQSYQACLDYMRFCGDIP